MVYCVLVCDESRRSWRHSYLMAAGALLRSCVASIQKLCPVKGDTSQRFAFFFVDRLFLDTAGIIPS